MAEEEKQPNKTAADNSGMNTMPQAAEEEGHPLMSTTLAVLVLVVVILGAGWWFLGNGAFETGDGDTDPAVAAYVEKNELLRDHFSAGNYSEAIAVFEGMGDVLTSNAVSDNRKAQTLYTIAEAYYQESGDIEDARFAIEAYKAIAENESVDRLGRAMALYAVGTSYCAYLDDRVMDFIYVGDYEQYRVEGDPSQSGRKVKEAAYELFPVSRIAADIAHWYANAVVTNPDLSESTREAYVVKAKQLIAESRALAEQEVAQVPARENTRWFAMQSFWRAFTIGLLAVAGEEDMERQYRREYENTIALVDTVDAHNMIQTRAYAHFYLAAFAYMLDEDEALAREELAKTIAILESDPTPQSNSFFKFVNNRKDAERTDDESFPQRALFEMIEISQPFSDFVDSV